MNLRLSEVREVVREELARSLVTESNSTLSDKEATSLEKASGRSVDSFRIIRVPPNDPPAAGGYNEGLLMAIDNVRSRTFKYDFEHDTWGRIE